MCVLPPAAQAEEGGGVLEVAASGLREPGLLREVLGLEADTAVAVLANRQLQRMQGGGCTL